MKSRPHIHVSMRLVSALACGLTILTVFLTLALALSLVAAGRRRSTCSACGASFNLPAALAANQWKVGKAAVPPTLRQDLVDRTRARADMGNLPQVAVFLPEPREGHAALVPVLGAIKAHLPGLPIVLLHPAAAGKAAAEEAGVADRTIVWDVPEGGLTFNEYNALMMEPLLYDAFPAQRMLIIQTDATPCAAPTKPLKHFFKWDVCGAPFPAAKRAEIGVTGRNGGFSLRSVVAMAAALRARPPTPTILGKVPAEDWHLARMAADGLVKECPLPEASMFAWESTMEGMDAVPVGVHKAYAYLPWDAVHGACKGLADLPRLQARD